MKKGIIAIFQVFFSLGIILLSRPAVSPAQEIIEEDSSSYSTQYEVIEENPEITPIPPSPPEKPIPPVGPSPSGRKPRGGAVITGSVLFGVSYGIGIFFVSVGAPATLLIPVAGPAATFLSQPYSSESIIPLAIGWSAAQAIGLGLLIRGLAGDPVQAATSNRLKIEPMISMQGAGLKLRLIL